MKVTVRFLDGKETEYAACGCQFMDAQGSASGALILTLENGAVAEYHMTHSIKSWRIEEDGNKK